MTRRKDKNRRRQPAYDRQARIKKLIAAGLIKSGAEIPLDVRNFRSDQALTVEDADCGFVESQSRNGDVHGSRHGIPSVC